jgi:hypothetical protein
MVLKNEKDNMNWQDLTWRHCGTPIDDSRIEEVEQVLGITFPDDFRECIKQCHKGSPSRQDFRVPSPAGEFGSCLGFLISFDRDDEDRIELICEDLEDIPNGIIPFAEDGGGDFICFDYNNPNNDGSPSVLYWHRAGLPGNEFCALSTSFSGFLELLS